MPFGQLELRSELKQSLSSAGYHACTPIQEMALPDALLGHDVIGVAKTGTGKTVAFLVPILQHLRPEGEPQALIICPTRELALQVGGEVEKLGHGLGVRCSVVYGGTSLGSQKRELLSGVDVVVGTPGRLLDFISSAYLTLRRVHWLVLDEADRMLDMGFIDDVDRILRRVPMSRQTMLFSATLPEPVMRLAHRYMLYPKEFRVDLETRVPEGIDQAFYRAPRGRKLDLLRLILRDQQPHKALVFTATRVSTSRIARVLRADGHEAYPISSDLRQSERERVLSGFREGSIRLLVATDVAARGIDIDDISHVINIDLPNDGWDYVHRIGRTGRVERRGVAISLVEPGEEPLVRQIEALIGERFPLKTVPALEAGRARAGPGAPGARTSSSRVGRGHGERGGASAAGGARHEKIAPPNLETRAASKGSRRPRRGRGKRPASGGRRRRG